MSKRRAIADPDADRAASAGAWAASEAAARTVLPDGVTAVVMIGPAESERIPRDELRTRVQAEVFRALCMLGVR